MPIRQLRTSFFRQCVYRSCAAYILYMERRAPARRTIKAFSGVGECVLLYNCCLRGEQELAVPYTGCTLPVYNDGEVLYLQLPVTGCFACYRCIAGYQHSEEKVIHSQPSLLHTCSVVYSTCYTQVLLISCT